VNSVAGSVAMPLDLQAVRQGRGRPPLGAASHKPAAGYFRQNIAQSFANT
jgi:hypothetical protein